MGGGGDGRERERESNRERRRRQEDAKTSKRGGWLGVYLPFQMLRYAISSIYTDEPCALLSFLFLRYLADKFGRKATIIPASVLISASALLVSMPMFNTFETMLPAVMLWGESFLSLS